MMEYLEYIFGFNLLLATLISLRVIVFILGFCRCNIDCPCLFSRGSKRVPDNLRWWKAIGLHFCFGFGLAYVDSSLGRKWLYPISFSGGGRAALSNRRLMLSIGLMSHSRDSVPCALLRFILLDLSTLLLSCRSQLKTNP